MEHTSISQIATMLPHTEPTPSYWNTPSIPISNPRLNSSKDLSIVIIGSGLTAVSIAYTLLPLLPTTHILVLEARSVCDGATGRNGGHCKVVPHEELDKLTARFGAKKAVELVRFQMRHLECLKEVCELVDTSPSGEKTEFRKVETVDLYVDECVFYEARGKVERMRAVMPDVEVKIWTADEAKKVWSRSVPITRSTVLTTSALRCQFQLPRRNILQGRGALPLPRRHGPLGSPRQDVSHPTHHSVSRSGDLYHGRLGGPVPRAHAQRDVSGPACHSRY